MSLLAALHLPRPSDAHTSAASAAPPPRAHAAPAAVKASASHAKTPKATTYNHNNYGALLVGLENENENRGKPKPNVDVGAFQASDLVGTHRTLLLGLHKAIVLVRSDPAFALRLWEQSAPGLRRELALAKAAKMEPDAIAMSLAHLQELDDKLFVPAAYYAANRQAQQDSDLEAPDAAQFEGRLKQAESDLMKADELFDLSLSVASKIGTVAGFEKPGQVKEIVELVMTPGSIVEKLKAASKAGIATTAAQLVSKVTGSTATLVTIVGETGKALVEARKAIVLAKGASKASKEALQGLEKLSTKFEKLAKVGKTLGKVASAAAVIADGVQLVGALRDGDWSAAGSAAVDLLVDAAPMVLGEAGGVAAAGIVVLAKAELEAIHLAADFIRYCKDQMVRDAALSFIEDCVKVAPGALRFVADCDLLINAENAGVQAMALRNATRGGAAVSHNIRALAEHVFATEKHAIGHYPGVAHSLGSEARSAFTITFTPDDGGVLMVAQQIKDVFHGANTMAKYVRDNFKN